MYKVEVDAVAPDPEWQERIGRAGSEVRWLVSRETCGSKGGFVGLMTIEPGAELPQHRTPGVERALYILNGSASTMPSGRSVAPGTAMYVREDGRVWLRAHEDPVQVLVLHGGVASPDDVQWELASDVSLEPEPVTVSDLPSVQAHDPTQGFYNMTVRWIFDAGSIGTHDFVLVWGVFPPGALHDLHHHPGADEFVLMLSGHGLEHLADEEAVEQNSGDIIYVPHGEVHGLRNASSSTGVVLAGYLGVSSLDDAGYVLHHGSDRG